MSEFIKIGQARVSTDSIRAVVEPATPGGDVILHYAGGHCEPVSADDGERLLEWAEGLCVKTPKADARLKAKADAIEKEKADKEEAEAKAAKAAEKEAAKAAHAQEAEAHAHHGKK